MARNKKSNKGSKEPRNYSAEEDRMILMEVLRTSPANLEEMQFWGDLAGRFDGKVTTALVAWRHAKQKTFCTCMRCFCCSSEASSN